MSLSACDVLLNLVPALQVEILVRWLHLHEVAKLDSALCLSENRATFLKIFDEEYCVFDACSSKQLAWVMRRKLKVSSAELTLSTAGAREKFFRRTGKHLRTLVSSAIRAANHPNIVLEISTMCKNLETLVFSKNDLRRDDICSVLPHLPRLQHLDLSLCINVTGPMIANINTQANIKVLNLSGCQIVDRPLPTQAVQGNHTIRTLLLTECKQINICLPFIHQCKALTTLYVNDIALSHVFTILQQCPALTTLSAGMLNAQSPRVTDQELTTLISLIQNLQVLHMYRPRCLQWEETQLERLIEGAPALRALFVSLVNGFVADGITSAINDVNRFVTEDTTSSAHSTMHSSQLHTLVVDDITIDELQNILQICPQLVSLSICEYGIISMDALELLSTIENSSIKILDIKECESFYSTDILSLHNLVSLSLDLCFELKHSDLVKLVNQNLNLRKLSLTGCAFLTQKAVLYIVQKCTSLEELVFDNINTGDNYHTYARGHVGTMDTTLIEGLIRLQHPQIKLNLQLLPELR